MFKARPYDPNREDNRTAAQKAAGNRNWRIFKLRGLYHQMWLLTEERRAAAQAAADAELVALGAEPETTRIERIQRERERYENFRNALIGDLPVI